MRLRGENGTAGTCRVTLYRIILADDESDASSTYENTIGAQTVSNTASTTIDSNTWRGDVSPDMSSQKVINSFTKTNYDSVWYHMIQKDIYEYLRPHSWKQDMINMTHHTKKNVQVFLKLVAKNI